jgi:hypothetical protein
MPGILEFEMELSRKAIITAAERKLARPLTEKERAGFQSISSVLQLNSIYRAFTSPTYSVAEVRADLERFTNQSNKE